MRYAWRIATAILVAGKLLVAGHAYPQTESAPAVSQSARDGGHDFDPLVGTWRFRLKRLDYRGSNTWGDLDGTGACYKLWDDRAQMDTVELDGSQGHIEGLTLRLYNPQSHQWRLYWANSKVGILDPPQIGEFRDGHGDFYTQDRINNKVIFVRFDWTRLTSATPHFEQAFSEDGGTNWEVNWLTDQTRTGDTPVWDAAASGHSAEPAAGSNQADSAATADSAAKADPQHAFDFDFGAWKIHMRRRLHPLAGSNEWTELDGTTVTRKIWNGKANIATVDASGPSGPLRLLSLRLYDPQAHQWRIHFVTNDEGVLSVPAVGEFRNGRGEFFDQEPFQGRSILVRFRIWQVSPNEISSDQAFSSDGGITWETNWVNTMTRINPST
ncbi:MAG TPA: hypothetical protein VKB38_17575 [Terracidiphilus sp.]|nr:hypothetical protein [Terracidiphilus sp.]